MSATITIKVLDNKRLIVLLLKKNFYLEDKDIVEIRENIIQVKTNYRIGKSKVCEKLEEAKNDYEVLKVVWSTIDDKEELELAELIKKKKKQ